MASIVYQIDEKTGTKYAFESISYWDKYKNRSQSKRKHLGKVDPETEEIITSRGRSSHSEENSAVDKDELQALHNEISEKDRTIAELRRELDELTEQNEEL